MEERWSRLPGLQRVAGQTAAAALTFDDGPDPDGTPAVLDALDDIGATATFFVLGQRLVRHHQLAHQIASRGHELALHGFTHVDHNRLAAEEARDELERGFWAYESILGRRPRWYRPPYGRSSEGTHETCRDLGLEIVYWSTDGEDWLPSTAEQIAGRVTPGLTGGAIVLLHDSASLAERESPAATAAAVRLIGAVARERRLELRALRDLVPTG